MVKPKRWFRENDAALLPGDRSDWIAVLPLGAHEQHGPHLPFETDTIIASGIARRLATALPDELPVTILPTEPIGYSIEHMDVEGTRTLAFDEAVNRWLGMAADLNALGIRKLVLLNAHGGNSPLLTIVATEARIRFAMLVVATSWTRFGIPEGWMRPEDKAVDIHGGDIETSVMLALAPDKVDMTKAEDFPSRQSDFAARFRHLRAYGPHAFGWKMSDLNPQGVAGNASAATAERGERLIAHSVKGLVELLEDVERFDVTRLR
ncbi:creatininase family protein [Peteryoungia ipomoeae]|uniref:Creatininase family protein n=1 Tax=Peteryoungia ipomoeae TaxID=1210932 RepID=A0A4S8NXA0_9HYPH|nr:creatininase family protein [Peteryoungia ipomoeae]THV21585.1 creatininase family protein [Peteryoungia ipomoeae]